MRILARWLLVAWVFGWAFPLFSQPAEPASFTAPVERPTGKVSTNLRYVPFDNFSQLFDKHPKGFLIPRAVFEEMKATKEAFLARRPFSPVPKLKEDVIFGRAEYRGTLKGEAAEFEAVFHLDVPNERWVVIPLPSGDIGFLDVTLDGKPAGILSDAFRGIEDTEAPKANVARLQQRFFASQLSTRLNRSLGTRRGQQNEFLLTIKDPGKHTLSVRFIVPKVDDPSKSELTFRIPRVPMNVFEVTLEESGQFGEVDRSEGTISRDREPAGTTVSGVLGSSDRFTLRWAPRTISAIGPRPVTPVVPVASESGDAPEPQVVKPVAVIPAKIDAVSFSLFSIGEGYIRNESLIQLNITRSPKGQITFGLPPKAELIDLRSDRLEKFTTQTDASGTRVTARLQSKVQGAVHFLLVTETKMASTSQVTALPVHWVEEAARDKGFIGVEPRTLVELRKMGEPEGEEQNLGVSTIDVSELPPEVANRALRPIILAYRYNAPPVEMPLQIDVRRHEDAPILTTAIDKLQVSTVLGNDENSVTCLDCTVKNNGQLYLDVRLATNSEIVSADLEGNPVKPVLKTGGEDVFRVPLALPGNSGAGKSQFQLRLVYRSKIPPISVHKKMEIALATFSVAIGRLDWRVYVPEDYGVIPLRSHLDRAGFRHSLVFFDLIADSIGFLQSPPFLMLLLVVGVLFLGNRFLGRLSGETSWGKAAKVAVGLGVVVLLFLVTATFQQGSRSNLFETPVGMSYHSYDKGGMRAQRSEVAPSMVPQQAVPMEMEIAQDESMERSDGPRPESKVQSLGMMKNEMGGKAKGSPMKAQKTRSAGRDRGALPVEMKIPATANFVDFFRNIVRPQDVTEFRGILLWNPLYRLSEFVHVLLGLVALLLTVFLAYQGLPLLTVAVFSLFVLATTVVEEVLPGTQGQLLIPFFMGLTLLLVLRILYNLNQWRKLGAVAVALLVFLGGIPVQAEDGEVNPRVEQLIDVYVPFSQLGDRLPKDVPLVYLKAEDYQYLKDVGVPEPDPARWTPPYSCVYLNGTFNGTVVEDRVELSVKLEANLLGKGFKYIVFPTEGVGIRSLTIDGEPVVFSHQVSGNTGQNDGQDSFRQMSQQMPQQMPQQMAQQMQQQMQMVQQSQRIDLNANLINNSALLPPGGGRRMAIVSEKEGRVVIEGVLVKDLFSKIEPSAKVQGFAFALPPFGMGTLHLTVPEPERQFEVQPSVRMEATFAEGKSMLTAVLQPASLLKVEWREKVEEKAAPKPEEAASETVPVVVMDPKVFVDHEILYSVEEGVIRMTDWVKINIEQSPVGEFVFEIPRGVEVRDVSGSDLGERKFPDRESDHTLVLGLNARRMHRVEFKIEMEREAPGVKGTFSLEMPWLISVSDQGVIERQKGYFGVEIPEGLEVGLASTSPATVVDPGELPETIRGQVQGFLAHAFKFLARPAPSITITKHRNVEVSTAQIDDGFARSLVTREGKVMTQYDLVVRNNNNQFLVLENPATGPRILSAMVNREPVKPGLGPKGEIYIPLIRSPRAGKAFQPFMVSLTFEETQQAFSRFGTFELTLPAISLDISELTWRIDVDDEYFLAKGPGAFQVSRKGMPSLPGRVQVGQDLAKFSNVMTQAALPQMEGRELEGASRGLLPVLIGFPETENVMVFGKNLVISRDPAPHLKVFYGKKRFLRLGQVFLALVVATLFAVFVWSIGGKRLWRAGFSGFALMVLWVGILIGGDLFREITNFFPAVEGGLIIGLQLGLLMLIVWVIFSWRISPPPAEKKPQAPA